MANSETRGIVHEVIAAFGGMSKTAQALGHRHCTTVQGWMNSGRIPDWRRLEILAAAEREGVCLPARFVASPARVAA
jgi:hypothetical protein